MAGQIGEFIEDEKIEQWTDLESVALWFNENGFEDGKVYSIYNNSSTSFTFLSGDYIDERITGTIAPQGTTIYFKPEDGSKIYIKGDNFNISISEIK